MVVATSLRSALRFLLLVKGKVEVVVDTDNFESVEQMTNRERQAVAVSEFAWPKKGSTSWGSGAWRLERLKVPSHVTSMQPTASQAKIGNS